MFNRWLKRIGTLDTPPPWSWVAALGAVIVAFAALVIGSFVAYSLLSEAQYTLLVAWSIGSLITIIFVFVRFAKPDERAALRLGGAGRTPESNVLPIQEIFLMLLIGVGLSVALDVISGRVTGLFLPDAELLPLYYDATLYGLPIVLTSWVFTVAFLVILQPVAEELVFRGLLLPSLRALTGAWPGYLLSAIVYAVFHLLAFPASVGDFNGLWYSFILPLIAGLIFGAVRLYTGSTRAAIWAHVGFGLFAVVKLLTLVG